MDTSHHKVQNYNPTISTWDYKDYSKGRIRYYWDIVLDNSYGKNKKNLYLNSYRNTKRKLTENLLLQLHQLIISCTVTNYWYDRIIGSIKSY